VWRLCYCFGAIDIGVPGRVASRRFCLGCDGGVG
jgi:hypothetical protein